jgi:hypothetical protein
MKKVLRFIPLAFIVLIAQSCSKTTWVPDAPPVTGSWVLSESTKFNGSGWYYFNTGLESGVFDFYSNGAARYDDGYNLMKGSWQIRTTSAGYYDQYGNYYNDLHDTFEVHVYDSYTHGSADLYFDDVVFTGDRIIATNYNGGSISRYVFRRY